jgi:hypothetical protein
LKAFKRATVRQDTINLAQDPLGWGKVALRWRLVSCGKVLDNPEVPRPSAFVAVSDGEEASGAFTAECTLLDSADENSAD